MTGATISAVETHFTRPRCLVVFAGESPPKPIATVTQKRRGYLVDVPSLNTACFTPSLSSAFAWIERRLESGITLMRGTTVQRRLDGFGRDVVAS